MENVLDNVSVASSQAVNAVLANKASESASSKFRPFIIYSPLVIYFMHKAHSYSQQGAENKSDHG
jgi:hypothetical protein